MTQNASQTALAAVPGWSEARLDRLKELWIDSADQVVALANTPGGLESLASQIDATTEETQSLVNAARNALPRTRLADMDKAVDTSQFGLGALPPQSKVNRR